MISGIVHRHKFFGPEPTPLGFWAGYVNITKVTIRQKVLKSAKKSPKVGATLMKTWHGFCYDSYGLKLPSCFSDIIYVS